MSAISKRKNIFPKVLKAVSVVFALILIMIPLSVGAVMYLNSPVEDYRQVRTSQDEAIRLEEDGRAFLIDIRRGESSQSVGFRLERAGLIKNRYFWNLLCRLDSSYIKTGSFRIELPATPVSIHRLLVSGMEILHKVTIPEGATLKRASLLLEAAQICTQESFMAAASDPALINYYGIPNETMEGFLFPDTYLFPGSFPADKVVRAMADNFFNRLETISASFRGMSIQELNEKVILASIIEREYRVAEEAAIMAGVFTNRLRINMALQSCATVEYIITEIQGLPHPNVLLYRDLEIRNPYNTYLYRGLPPGPICAPGETALHAAMYPQNTDYLFFRLIDPASGRHYFSRTHDAHIAAGDLIPKGRL